jgi:hypothetical protein
MASPETGETFARKSYAIAIETRGVGLGRDGYDASFASYPSSRSAEEMLGQGRWLVRWNRSARAF